jgi:hypothetical protein
LDGVVQVVRTVDLCAVCTCIMCTHHIHVVRSAVVQPKGTRCVYTTQLRVRVRSIEIFKQIHMKIHLLF